MNETRPDGRPRGSIPSLIVEQLGRHSGGSHHHGNVSDVQKKKVGFIKGEDNIRRLKTQDRLKDRRVCAFGPKVPV